MPAVIEFPVRVIERVHKEIVVDPLTGCHLSTLSTQSEGYSQIGWQEDGVPGRAYGHRVVWIAANGPIPDGLVVDHQCYTRRCVNIEHLRLLSVRDNSRRKEGYGDWPTGVCRFGHSDDLIKVVAATGKRRCGACWDTEQKTSERRRMKSCVDCEAAIDRKATRCVPCFKAHQKDRGF